MTGSGGARRGAAELWMCCSLRVLDDAQYKMLMQSLILKVTKAMIRVSAVEKVSDERSHARVLIWKNAVWVIV